MRYFYIIGFLVLICFDTLAQISFKYASIYALPVTFDLPWLIRIFSHPWIYGAFIGYIGAFFTWMTLLRHAPVGPAFAASHLEIISVTLLSIWLFHEPLTLSKIIGAILILAGVMFLAKSESAEVSPHSID
ncbi:MULTISPECIES: DMT family transporter [unclassified Acinetobacter]|uniref:DMT family transporter n=1 Tax=unclassified Acinetobacter TaxID=196816 RepID=UPI002934D223|nr:MULTISPECIES: EamA family transporter [unclassified Acinetobacter]WOE31851.1 EamA family transporter [Acinetobacter sp. SAAs470]WOE37318.1 EamA family transporter [Acinetobacter sp. SAAs474]